MESTIILLLQVKRSQKSQMFKLGRKLLRSTFLWNSLNILELYNIPRDNEISDNFLYKHLFQSLKIMYFSYKCKENRTFKNTVFKLKKKIQLLPGLACPLGIFHVQLMETELVSST